MADAADTCRHYHPRKDTHCGRAAEYVIDYASGLGACREHVGHLTAWALDDKREITVHTRAAWTEKAEWDS